MKKIAFDLDNNPFMNFQSSRYSMTARVDATKTYNYSKQNNYSFFILSLGCMIKAANRIPHFKRRIINNEAIEYESLDGVTPIMDEDNHIYREMRVKPPEKFSNIGKWHDYVKKSKEDILLKNEPGFTVAMENRDYENIINCSCIPWVDFDSMTNCVESGNQIQPLISWGKLNKKLEISVSVTVSHIFVNGRELGYFYENLQDCFNNPEDLI